MNKKEIEYIFGKQLRQLSMSDFEKRKFNFERNLKNGI